MTEQADRKYPLETMADAVMEMFCSQITQDYTAIIRRELLPELGELNMRELRVLMVLDFLNEDVTARTVADTLRYDPGTVSRATKRLMEIGLVLRQGHASDKRQAWLGLTHAGRALADRYRTLFREKYNRFESESGLNFTPEERRHAIGILLKLRERSQALNLASQRLNREAQLTE